MSDRTVTISLQAKDGTSHVFAAVAKSGESMADALKRAGQDASKGLDDLGESAKRSDADMQKLMGSAKDVGLGIGVLVGGLALSGKAFRDNQIAIDTMRRGYASSADEMLKFADAQQAATNFSNDAVVAAENVSRTLAANYGFSDSQIQQLIARTEDLAAAQGKDLGYAIQATSSAMRGEAEMAEQLGLTLNDHALGIDKLSASTSEAEKAGVRFNAFLEQSSYAQGVAQEQAHGTYGMLVELGHGFQDAGQDIGDFLGPLGEVGAYASDNAVKVAALGLSIGQLAKGAVGAKNLIGAAGLAGTAGIAGLGLAAGAAAVGGLFLLKNVLVDDLPSASQSSIDSMQELINTIVEAGDKSEYAITIMSLDDVMTENKKVVDGFNSSLATLTHAQGELIDQGSAPIDADIFEDLTQHQRELIDANGDLWISYDEVTAAAANWETQANSAAAVNQGLTAGLDELAAIWQETGEAGQFAQKEAMAYTQALLAGEITPQRYEQLLQALITGYENAGEAALAASASVMNFDGALGGVALTGKRTAGDLMLFFDEIAHGITAVDENRIAWEKWKKELDSNHYVAQLQHDSLDGVSRGLDAVTVAIKTAQGELDNLDFTQLRDFGGEFKYDFSFGSGLNGMSQAEAAAVELQTVFEGLQSQFTNTAENLDTIYGAIVGNTDAIANQSQAVADWSTGLLDAALSAEDYGTALESNNRILEANAAIQDDVLSIQAQLSPVVASATEALAAQMDEIRDGSIDAQLFALGMMDANTSMQAMQLANDYLSNQDVFGPMMVQAAKLSPMLAQIWEEMGLISYNPITNEVKLLGIDNAESEIGRLTAAIDKLVMTEWMMMLGVDATQAEAAFEAATGQAVDWDGNESTAAIGADNTDALGKFQEAENRLAEWNRSQGTSIADIDNSGADAALSDAQNRLAEWDRSTGTATMNVNDNATGTAALAIALVHQFDGLNATATMTTYYNAVGTAEAHQLANGGVLAAAMGRVIADEPTWVGEAGPELLLNRTMVFPHTGSMASGQKPGGGVTIENHFHIAGHVIGVDDLTLEVVQKMAPALQRAVAAHVGSV